MCAFALFKYTNVNCDLDSCVGGKDSSLRRINYQSQFVEEGPFSSTFIEQVSLFVNLDSITVTSITQHISQNSMQ